MSSRLAGAAAVAALLLVACAGSKPTSSDLRDGSQSEILRFPDAAVAELGNADRARSDQQVPLPTQPFGINMPNLLHAYVGQAPVGPAAVRQQLDRAKLAGFTHIRFIASGFWPKDMNSGKGWLADPTAYFQAFDALVADVKARGLKLVPSLLWNTYLFPDLAGEPVSKLFTTGSKTRQLAEKYITEVVTRYASSGAILFWELGNETNLLADLDVSDCNVCPGSTTKSCGGLAPSLGTPCKRTAADNIYSCNACRGATGAVQDLGELTGAIAKLVAGLDPAHPFSSGNGYPRPSAWHLAKSPCPSCDWTPDSPDELGKAIAQLHPAGVGIVSVHHYPGADAARFGSIDEMGIDLLKKAQALTKGLGKQLYVGEHGEPRAGSISCGETEVCGGDATRMATRRLLDALVSEEVPYSALWAYEFYQFCADVPTCYTVTANEEIVGAFGVHNQARGSCQGQKDGAQCPIGKCAAGKCAPVRLGGFSFDAPGDEASWLLWTNCSACTAGKMDRPSTGPTAGHLRLTSFDLPCGTGCSYPGVYALSPSIAVSSGQVLVRAAAHTAAGAAGLRLIAYDSAAKELQQAATSVPKQNEFRIVATWMKLPAGTSAVRIRLELSSPASTLDVDDIVVEGEP